MESEARCLHQFVTNESESLDECGPGKFEQVVDELIDEILLRLTSPGELLRMS